MSSKPKGTAEKKAKKTARKGIEKKAKKKGQQGVVKRYHVNASGKTFRYGCDFEMSK